MSQAGELNTAAGPVPPAVATSYVTNSGTAVPVANVLTILGAATSANNDNGIFTTGSGSTVTVVLSNRIEGTTTTVGAVTGDVVTLDLGVTPAVYRFSVLVTGRDTTSGDGVGYTVDGSIKTNGSVATIISTPDIDADKDPSLATALISMIASGNNVIIRATGVAGITIIYKSIATYVVV